MTQRSSRSRLRRRSWASLRGALPRCRPQAARPPVPGPAETARLLQTARAALGRDRAADRPSSPKAAPASTTTSSWSTRPRWSAPARSRRPGAASSPPPPPTTATAPPTAASSGASGCTACSRSTAPHGRSSSPRRDHRPAAPQRRTRQRPTPRADPSTNRIDLPDLQRPAYPRTPRRPHPARPARPHLQPLPRTRRGDQPQPPSSAAHHANSPTMPREPVELLI